MSIAQKQRETYQHIHVMKGNLHTVKTMVDGRLNVVEGSLTGLISSLGSEFSSQGDFEATHITQRDTR